MATQVLDHPAPQRARGGGGPRRTVLRTQLAGVGRRPARLLLTGLAVLVAAFVVAGAILTHSIMVTTVLDTFSGTPAAASLVVRAKEASPEKVRQLAGLPGVVAAASRLETSVTPPGDNPFLVSADPGSGPLSLVRVVAGTYPTKDDETAVGAKTAKVKGLSVGGTVTVLHGGNPKATSLRVTGIVESAQKPSTDLFLTGDGASALQGPDRADVRIDLAASPQADLAALRTAVTSTLGGEVEIRTGAQARAAEARDAVREFDEIFALVGMFIAIAVGAAALVATSTFRIVFAQRMRQLALLRAVGADRGKITGALTVEGLVTGLVAGTVGTVAAVGLAYLAPALLALADVRISAPTLPVLSLAATVLGAALITIVAVLAPARSAAKVAPLQALRDASVTEGRRGIGRGRLAAGLLCLVAALAMAFLVHRMVPSSDTEVYNALMPLLGVVCSGFLAYCALMALGPVLVQPILVAISWPARLLGPVGRLAVGGVGGAPRRAAAVSTVVGLGVTLVAGILVGAASMQAYVDRGMALEAPTDFQVAAESRLPAGVAEKLSADPNLARVAPYRQMEVQLDGQQTTATDLRWNAVRAFAAVDAADGSFANLGPGRAILSAESVKKSVGETVTLASATGTVTLTVAAVLPGQAPLGASILVDPADLGRLGAAAEPSGLLADAAKPGREGRQAGVAAISAFADQGVGLVVLVEAKEAILAQFASVVWIALALIGLTVLIAVVGVGATTALSVVERMRESGLLRAVGLSRRRLLGTLTAEAGLYGLLGGILGIALGVPYAWLAVYVLNMGAPLKLPVLQMLAVVVALTLITALAGLLPARRAARVSPVTALGSAE